MGTGWVSEYEHANPLKSAQWVRNKSEDTGADDALGQGCESLVESLSPQYRHTTLPHYDTSNNETNHNSHNDNKATPLTIKKPMNTNNQRSNTTQTLSRKDTTTPPNTTQRRSLKSSHKTLGA